MAVVALRISGGAGDRGAAGVMMEVRDGVSIRA
jgi:hypothetical protein